MALLRRVPPKAAITAAASRVFQPDLPQSRSLAPDAPALYGLYDRLGQIRAALQFKSMAASKIDYYVARKTDPGESPEKVEEGPAVEAFQRLQGTLGEFADFVSEFCLHLDIAGEGYLIGRGTEDPSLDDDWDVWSPVEYDMLRLGQQRLNIPDAPKPLEDDDFVSVADLGRDERLDDAFDAATKLGRIVVHGVEDLHGRYPPTNASPNRWR